MIDTGGREAARRPTRAPLRRRSRQRWMVAGGVAACWLLLEVVTGSVVSATVVLMVIAALTAAGVGGLRALGITRDHPWIRRIASRPWRDGQDVLKVVMRHLADVFVVTPSGALIAPNLVELQLNPDDLAFLCERMEPGVIGASMTEVYREQVTAYGARLAGAGRAEVYVIGAGSVARGRYRLRHPDPVSIDAQPDRYANAAPEWAYSAPQHGYADSGGYAWGKPDPDLTVSGGMATIMEPSPALLPVLQLVTGSSVAETRVSGARAGRGSVELVLPDVLTVSREHATFTFSDGRWWVTNQGRNGLTLNGVPVVGEQPLSDGDTILWGASSDAPLSRVKIGLCRECDNCHSRHGKTGRPRQGRAVVREWRRSGDGSAFPVVSGAGRVGELSA